MGYRLKSSGGFEPIILKVTEVPKGEKEASKG